MPEHHWPAFVDLPLDRAVRIRFNHFAVRFTCEMFIYFEHSIIEYMRRHRARLRNLVKESHRVRFIEEEKKHTDAFYRLLFLLRPDLYDTRDVHFLKPSRWDRLLLFLTPPATFFIMAELFEEMTIFVPAVMAERPEHSFAPVYEVMKLHAEEELGHVRIDTQALEIARERAPGWIFGAQALWSLPLMLYAELKLRSCWKKAVGKFAAEENLTPEQAKLLVRKPSRSDILGFESFLEKKQGAEMPGLRILCAILKKVIR